MTDRDGIYLNNTWVCSSEAIAVTFQGNDLTKPDSLQASYSNSFSIPDTVAVRQLTGFAEQLDSGSSYPYKLVPAYVIAGGEYIFKGVAKLTNFSGGWKAALYEEKRDLFARLTRSIRTADLSRFDHEWTPANISARVSAIDGVCYPVIDYGLASGNIIPLDTMFPAVFVHTIVRQLLKEEGYKFVGDLPDNPLFQQLALPFVEAEGTNHDQKWSDDRKARVTQNNVEYSVNRDAWDSGHVMDRIQPFTIDNVPADTWTQGVLKNYDTKTYSYVCDSAMRVRVDAFQQFKVRNTTGAVEFMLIVEKNGQNVYQEYLSPGGPYNLLYSRNDRLEIHKTIPCVAGDRLQIRFVCQRRTSLSAFSVTIYNDSASSWVAFTPDLSLKTNDNWPVSRNLPDITGVALLVDLAHIFGGTWAVDTRRRQIKFVSLSKTIANTANAVDWSNRLDTGQEPTYTPILSPYAQFNYLKWKEFDDTKSSDGGLNYGDGLISINAETLDTKVDLFELSFAATINSANELSGYGNPLRIETRSVSGTTSSQTTISNKNTTPRMIVVSTDESVTIATKKLATDGLTIEDITVQLKPCWFGPRPNSSIKAETAFCLCFSGVKNLRGELVLIDAYYPGLKRVLRRMRSLGTSIRLYPEDIAQLDFEKPIRLRRVSVGSLTLSDGHYYLNSINNYKSNTPCTATLIAF